GVGHTASTWDVRTLICPGGNFLRDGIVDFEFYGPDGTRESQTIYSFITLGEARFDVNFVATPGTLLGTHTLKVGIFSGDWTTLYRWDNQAATFEVPSTAACTGGFTIGPTVAVPSVVIVTPTVGGPQTFGTDILTHVCSGTALSNIILDFELYGPDGIQEFQSIYRPTFPSFPTRRSYDLDVTFVATPGPLVGTHTLKVGIFSGDW